MAYLSLFERRAALSYLWIGARYHHGHSAAISEVAMRFYWTARLLSRFSRDEIPDSSAVNSN